MKKYSVLTNSKYTSHSNHKNHSVSVLDIPDPLSPVLTSILKRLNALERRMDSPALPAVKQPDRHSTSRLKLSAPAASSRPDMTAWDSEAQMEIDLLELTERMEELQSLRYAEESADALQILRLPTTQIREWVSTAYDVLFDADGFIADTLAEENVCQAEALERTQTALRTKSVYDTLCALIDMGEERPDAAEELLFACVRVLVRFLSDMEEEDICPCAFSHILTSKHV